jgi:hypothetical protein
MSSSSSAPAVFPRFSTINLLPLATNSSGPTAGQAALMAVFSAVSQFNEPADGNLFQWFYDVSPTAVSALLLGDRVLVPSIIPEVGNVPSVEFLASCGPCLLQVVANANVGLTCRVKFKVMGYLQPPDDWGDQSPPFTESSFLLCTLPANSYMVVVLMNSVLGGAVARIGAPLASVRHRDDDEVGCGVLDMEAFSSVSQDSPLKRGRLDEPFGAGSQDFVLGTGVASHQKGKCPFSDLDGVVRFVSDKLSITKINENLCLFRLLDEARLKTFLPRSFIFSVEHWRMCIMNTRAAMVLSPDNSGPIFRSMHRSKNCECLLVYEDSVLFGKFICCQFEAFLWTGVSLGQFLRKEDRNVLWVDEPTDSGRSRIVTALQNVELMLYVNFDPCFENEFTEITSWILHNPAVAGFHDVFIKSHLDLMLTSFFNDVRSNSSFFYPDHTMRSAAECRVLLLHYAEQFVGRFLDYEAPPITYSMVEAVI